MSSREKVQGLIQMEIECSSDIVQALIYKQHVIITDAEKEILSLKKRLAEAEAEAVETAKSAASAVKSAEQAVTIAIKRSRMSQHANPSEYAYPYPLDPSFLSYFPDCYSQPYLPSPPRIKRVCFLLD